MNDEQPKRRRWLRRFAYLGLTGLSIVVLIAAAITWSRLSGRSQLKRVLAELEADGIELDWRKIRPPQEASDGAHMLIETGRIGGGGAARAFLPSPARMVGPGIFASALDRTTWSYFGITNGSYTTNSADWEFVARAFESHQTAVAAYRRALALEPPKFSVDYDSYPNMKTPHTGPALDTSVWLTADVLRSIREERYGEAHQSLLATLHLTQGLASERGSWSLVVGQSVQNLAFRGFQEAAGRAEWDDQQWFQIQEAFAAVDWTECGRMSLALDVALGWRLYERVATNIVVGQDFFMWRSPEWLESSSYSTLNWMEARLPGLHGWLDGGLDTAGTWWSEDVFPQLWNHAWREADAAVFLGKHGESMREINARTNDVAITRLVEETDWDRFLTPELSYTDSLVRQLSGRLEGLIYSERFLSSLLIAQHRARLATTVCAIRRYRLAYGSPPPTLDALVPEFMVALPPDPGDGQPLRYSLNGDGLWRLYSTGLDGQDDGGDGNPGRGFRFDPDVARDIVWPRPGTAEEVATFEKAFAERRATSSPGEDPAE